MKSTSMSLTKFFVLAAVMALSTVTFAQTYTTTANGAWTTGGTWAGGTAPSDWSNYSAIVNHNVTSPSVLNGYTLIRLNGGKSFTSGTAGTPQNLSMQNVSSFLINNGNVTVYGNLTLTSSNMTITAGTLTVTGTLTLKDGATLTNNGSGAISVGAFTTSGSGGTLTLNNGSLAVSGGMSINSGSTVTIASGKTVTVASLALSNNSDAILNNSGSITVNGNVSQGGTLNNLSGGVLQINGNLTGTGSGSSVLTNTGALNVTGNADMPSSSKMQINPGGVTTVNGNFTVNANENLVVGTNVAPPAYADLVIKGNLLQSGSGDVKIRQNGRFAVFGNVSDAGGGDSRITVESGGQAYVHGNINYTGGGSKILNSNVVSPYGLYVNGTTSNSGGGSTTTANMANLATLQTTNVPFYNWINSIPGNPLPVELVYFKIAGHDDATLMLAWATASEKNSDHFVIERSENGIDFTSIGTVAAAGTTNIRHDYTFNDNMLVNGRLYYRLVSVDQDGHRESFKVVFIDLAIANRVELYPNPSSGLAVNIRTNFDAPADARFEVYDSRGFVIASGMLADRESSVAFGNQLKPGTYLLHYASSTHQEVVRFAVK